MLKPQVGHFVWIHSGIVDHNPMDYIWTAGGRIKAIEGNQVTVATEWDHRKKHDFKVSLKDIVVDQCFQ